MNFTVFLWDIRASICVIKSCWYLCEYSGGIRADFVSTLLLWFLVDACFLYEFCGNEISEFLSI